VLFLATSFQASAVIVAGGDGTQNTTGVGAGDGWDYVGTVNGASGVYLGDYDGNYWVITANHVGGGSFNLGGTTYSMVGGSGLRIGTTDIYLFRINSDPGLTNLTLSSTAPTINSQVTLIGAGRNRDASLTTYYIDTDTDPDTWSTTDSADRDVIRAGYDYASGKTKRWGEDTISGTGTALNTEMLFTTFGSVAGATQVATGDSGGGVFYQNPSTMNWELTGIISVKSTFNGQPNDTAVFGNESGFADLSQYRDQILAAVPEPSSATLIFLAAAALLNSRRRKPAL